MLRLGALAMACCGVLNAGADLVLPFFNHANSANLDWIGESIAEFFSIKANQELVKRLRDAGLTMEGEKKERGTKLAGKTFVLTGTLARYSRDEAKKMIEDAGEAR